MNVQSKQSLCLQLPFHLKVQVQGFILNLDIVSLRQMDFFECQSKARRSNLAYIDFISSLPLYSAFPFFVFCFWGFQPTKQPVSKQT